MATFRRAALRAANSALGFSGLQLVRLSENAHIKSYQPFKRTLEEARKAGLKVGDYIDKKFQVPGATQATIDQLSALGVLGEKVQRICEIGPGSGRYLEKVQQRCRACSYEIYETDKPWSDWLARTYHVTAHDADGTSLCSTPSEAVELVHAHKVFVYLPAVVVCGYFQEMIRVVCRGGWIVFDIVSEECLSNGAVEKWIVSKIYYPCMMPREFVINFFARRLCSLRGSFYAPMMPGQSEYLVFSKDATQSVA